MDVLLHEGLWGVGDDKSICVFNEPWVYPKEGFMLEDRNDRPTDHTMKVHELLNEDRTWNEELVRCVVPSTDAESVLQIPIPAREVED